MDAINSLDDFDRQEVVAWLRDCARDAAIDEPSVGVFGNDRMAAAFTALADMVERNDRP
jgi:hypothetical protein